MTELGRIAVITSLSGVFHRSAKLREALAGRMECLLDDGSAIDQ